MDSLTGAMRMGLQGEGVLSMVSRFVVHEGSGYLLVREDGTVDQSAFRRFEHGVAVSPTDIELRGIDAIREVMAETQEALAKHQHEALFEELSAATKAAGTEVKAGGKPFSAELWLEGLEKMQFSFDLEGNWRPPTIVIHPDQADRVKTEIERLEADPVLIQRMEAIIEAKRQDWRDREARRRVVD